MITRNFITESLFLLLLIGTLTAQAQVKEQLEQTREALPYKSRIEFNQDTLKYLEYNFTKRGMLYKEKKVSVVLKDLDMPVLYVAETTWSSGDGNPSRLRKLSLSVLQKGNQPNILEDYYIIINFADPPLLDDYKKVTGFGLENSHPLFTQKLYDFLKDLVVSDVESNPYIIQKREAMKNVEIKDANR